MGLINSNSEKNLKTKNEIWEEYFNPKIVGILSTVQIALTVLTSGIVILLMTSVSAQRRPWNTTETIGLVFTILPVVSAASTFITAGRKSFLTLHITMITQAIGFGLSLALAILCFIQAVQLKGYDLRYYEDRDCVDKNGTLVHHKTQDSYYYGDEKIDCDERDTVLAGIKGSILFHYVLGSLAIISAIVATVIFGMVVSTVWNLRFELDAFSLKHRENYSVDKARLISWSLFVTSLIICGAQMSMSYRSQLAWSLMQLFSFSTYALTINWFLVTEATYLKNVFMVLLHEGCVTGVITVLALFTGNYESQAFMIPIGILQILQYGALAGMALMSIVKVDMMNEKSSSEAEKEVGTKSLI